MLFILMAKNFFFKVPCRPPRGPFKCFPFSQLLICTPGLPGPSSFHAKFCYSQINELSDCVLGCQEAKPAEVWRREGKGCSRRSQGIEGPLPSAIPGRTFLNKGSLTEGQQGGGAHFLWERKCGLVKKRAEGERGYSSKGSVGKWRGEGEAVNCSPSLDRRPGEGAQMIRNVLS